MGRLPTNRLSRRERQIMDIVYRMSQPTVAEIRDALPDPPTLSAVRAMLRILESKGYLRHKQDGPRHVFLPTVPRKQARIGALRQLVQTFFNGSRADAVEALLEDADSGMSDEELARITQLLAKARKEGR